MNKKIKWFTYNEFELLKGKYHIKFEATSLNKRIIVRLVNLNNNTIVLNGTCGYNTSIIEGIITINTRTYFQIKYCLCTNEKEINNNIPCSELYIKEVSDE